MRWHEAAPEDIADVFYYGDYYSDRGINKYQWDDEPRKDLATRYPLRKDGVKGGKRCRARQDTWITLSFYIEV
jgi:hypothetical protein